MESRYISKYDMKPHLKCVMQENRNAQLITDFITIIKVCTSIKFCSSIHLNCDIRF